MIHTISPGRRASPASRLRRARRSESLCLATRTLAPLTTPRIRGGGVDVTAASTDRSSRGEEDGTGAAGRKRAVLLPDAAR